MMTAGSMAAAVQLPPQLVVLLVWPQQCSSRHSSSGAPAHTMLLACVHKPAASAACFENAHVPAHNMYSLAQLAQVLAHES
jgi:hypothetical protein